MKRGEKHPCLPVPLCAGIVLTLCALVASCSRNAQPLLPPRLGGAMLVRTVAGTDARDAVDAMHGKGVAPLFSEIGFYGDAAGSRAVLYASAYEDSSGATDAEEKMRARIAKGSGPFSGYAEYVVAGRGIAGCNGMGQRHYFFSAGRRLYWLAAPPETAFLFAQEMITGFLSSELRM